MLSTTVPQTPTCRLLLGTSLFLFSFFLSVFQSHLLHVVDDAVPFVIRSNTGQAMMRAKRERGSKNGIRSELLRFLNHLNYDVGQRFKVGYISDFVIARAQITIIGDRDSPVTCREKEFAAARRRYEWTSASGH